MKRRRPRDAGPNAAMVLPVPTRAPTENTPELLTHPPAADAATPAVT